MRSARFLMHSACFLLIAAFATGVASAQTCDRACLKTTLDQYLNAVVKHDTSAAPLFVAFWQTDNGVVVRPGTGTWQSITALGDIQRKFFDPVGGQAAYLGLIKEGQATGIATLRLRVENQLGFKMVKWIESIEFVENLQSVGEGKGGYAEDHEYFGALANI